MSDPSEAMSDHYAALQVSRTAPGEVVAAAYRALTGSGPPDPQVEEAWAVLGDPDRRAAYDASQRPKEERPASGCLLPLAVVAGFLATGALALGGADLDALLGACGLAAFVAARRGIARLVPSGHSAGRVVLRDGLMALAVAATGAGVGHLLDLSGRPGQAVTGVALGASAALWWHANTAVQG
jgi:hypothetical protein